MKTLSRDAIQRMTGRGTGGNGGGGGGGSLAGYATESWVNENYLSIEFFSKLFKAYDSATPTPNEVLPNDTQSTITNIKAMFGFWTEQYLSALGQGSGGGGGGGGTVTSVAMSVPTGFSVSGSPITSSGTLSLSFASGYSLPTTAKQSNWDAVYSWYAENPLSGYATQSWVAQQNYATQSWVAQQNYATQSAISDMATKTWVGQQGYLTSVAFSDLTTHPTTLSGYGITDAYSKTDADAKFMTIAAFENLFNAMASDGETKVNHPYSSAVASIKAKFGLWTEQYLSALGIGSGGGGGGTGTVTSITAGTGLSGGTITSSGTIAISSTYQTYISHGETAYGWGNHANAGYLTSSSNLNASKINSGAVGFNYLPSLYIGKSRVQSSADANVKLQIGDLWLYNEVDTYGTRIIFGDTNVSDVPYVYIGEDDDDELTIYAAQGLHLTTDQNYTATLNGYDIATEYWVGQQGFMKSNATTFWGQSVSNGAVNGNIEAGNIGGSIGGFHSIELNTHGTLSGYGGFIDFHFNGSTDDYTTRLIEETSGTMTLYGKLKIGNAVIEWDSTNQCLKVTGDLVSTGAVTALA